MTEPISAVLNGTRNELVKMTWPEYKSFPALNGSTLTAGLIDGEISLLHLHYYWQHGMQDTDAMQFGRMAHCLLLEPDEVADRYWPWEGRRAGNDYKAFLAKAQLEGAEVVRAEGQYSLASAVEAAKSFLKDRRVKQLIKAGEAEQSVLAIEAGLQCKGQLDWVSTSEHVLTDLKTTGRIARRPFGKSFFDLGYHVKLGLYRRWLVRLTNDHWPVEVIVLERNPPYDVAVVPVPDAVLDAGVDKAKEIIDAVKTAIFTDQWPGVAGGDIMPLVVPSWVMDEEIIWKPRPKTEPLEEIF